MGYRIVFTSVTGDTVRIVEYDSSDIPLRDIEWREQMDRWREFQDAYPGGSCGGRLVRPQRKRLTDEIMFDEAGRMWVERVQSDASAVERFDVFSPGGALIGSVITPRRTWTARPFFRGNTIYLVTADSLDIPRVQALRFSASNQR